MPKLKKVPKLSRNDSPRNVDSLHGHGLCLLHSITSQERFAGCFYPVVACSTTGINLDHLIMWFFKRKGSSGFSSSSTAEKVTHGIDASGLTAIVTGHAGVYVFFYVNFDCSVFSSYKMGVAL